MGERSDCVGFGARESSNLLRLGSASTIMLGNNCSSGREVDGFLLEIAVFARPTGCHINVGWP